ncbi:MAG: FtsH protease activity modulator HflK, partial [Planctomycetota bacterium]
MAEAKQIAAFGFSRRRIYLALAVLGIVWCAITGVQVIEQNEQGVVLRFGRVVRTCPAGFHVTFPWPVETVRVVRTTEVRTMPVGFRLRDKARRIPPLENEVQWLTGDTNIVEIQAVLQYMIKDPVDFLFRVADLDADTPKYFALRSIGESVLTSLVARMKVDDVLSIGKAALQEDGRRRIQEIADGMRLGVQVLSVNIVEANPPPDVIAAFNDVTSAKADRERLLSEADGFAKDLLPKARAQADRIVQEAEMYRSVAVNRARGSASRFRDLSVEVAASPRVSRRRL